jgi:hypothetical protein
LKRIIRRMRIRVRKGSRWRRMERRRRGRRWWIRHACVHVHTPLFVQLQSLNYFPNELTIAHTAFNQDGSVPPFTLSLAIRSQLESVSMHCHTQYYGLGKKIFHCIARKVQ